jgi:hypothetical protein
MAPTVNCDLDSVIEGAGKICSFPLAVTTHAIGKPLQALVFETTFSAAPFAGFVIVNSWVRHFPVTAGLLASYLQVIRTRFTEGIRCLKEGKLCRFKKLNACRRPRSWR